MIVSELLPPLQAASTSSYNSKEVLASTFNRSCYQKVHQIVPVITFKRVKSIKDRVVHSHHNPVSTTVPALTGTFSCGACDICSFISNKSDILLPNGMTHSIKHRVTCQTPGVVYIMQCQCECYYISKTKCPFFKRIRDHVGPIAKQKMARAVSTQVGLYHN